MKQNTVGPIPTGDAVEKAVRRASLAAGILPSTFRAALTSVTEQRQQYRRAAYMIDSRHARLRTSEASGSRKSEIRACPDPRAVDPWAVDASALPGQTLTITVCPSCHAEKKVGCTPCGGAGQLLCSGCGGSGQIVGQRGPKNCPSCRGKGTRRCNGCHGRGRIECPTCKGLGRVRAWLEIEQRRRRQVKAHPQDGIAQLHLGLEDGRDLDRDSRLFPVPLVSDTGWGKELPAGLGAELLPTFDTHTDRIASRRLQIFASKVHHCHYRLVTGSAVAQICAQPLQALSQSDWKPWRRRSHLALAVGGLVSLTTLVYVRAFTGRAEWFAHHASVGFIVPVGLVSAILAALAARGMCLPRSAWGWLRVQLPTLAVLALWVFMSLLWIGVRPSATSVYASVRRDDLAAARQELAALEAVGARNPESLAAAVEALMAAEAKLERERRWMQDEAHLDRIGSAGTTLNAITEFERRWGYQHSQELARHVVLERARESIVEFYKRHDDRGLGRLAGALAPHDAGLAARARARQRLCEAYACSSNEEWQCAVAALAEVEPAEDDVFVQRALTRARDEARAGLIARLNAGSPSGRGTSLAQQKKQLEQRLADAHAYTALTGEEPPVDIHRLEKRIGSIERKLDKKRKRNEPRRR